MKINFNELNQNNKEVLTNPKSIFTSLKDKSSKYGGYLRDVQSDVLEQWYENRNNKNTIIKMNTGSGKTLVALLILKSCMNENKGNAIYVVPNNYLIEQVAKEAEDLGIEVVTSTEDLKFIKKEAILIINIYKLINGKSVFGLKDKDNIKIDNIIIDDVHACLDSAKSQVTININKENIPELYNNLFLMFRESLQKQNFAKLIDIENNATSQLMVVPFNTIIRKKEQILQCLSNAVETVPEIKFSIDLLKEYINLCDIIISSTEIEISLPCLPIHKIKSFENAKRRIFLSATLNDDSDLVKELNIIDNIKVICPKDNSDIGNRMILMPQSINPKISDEEIKQSIKKISLDYKTFVIVPSFARASFWEDVADYIYTADNIAEIHNHDYQLNVLVGRYDGIDLPDDMCRMLVIDGLPDNRTMSDLIEEEILINNSESLKRKVQMVEQGMGRGVRSNSDYCAVIIMNYKLIKMLSDLDILKYFSEATRKQIELSNEIAKQLTESSINDILSVFDYCLHKDEQWITVSIKALADLKNETEIHCNQSIISLRKAYNSAFQQDYDQAIDYLNELVSKELDNKKKGYYIYLIAKNYANKDSIQSEKLLKEAKRLNSGIPITSIVPIYKSKKNKNIKQSDAIMEFCKNNRYENPTEYLLNIQAITEDLHFNKTPFNTFENAIYELGKSLGFESTRPEKQYGKGPDNLWIDNDKNYCIIECKNEATSNIISKDYCEQLLGSINWVKEEYGNNISYFSIIIHPSNIIDWRASIGNEKIKVINQTELENFKERVIDFSNNFINPNNYENSTNIKQLIDEYKLSLKEIITQFTVLTTLEKKK